MPVFPLLLSALLFATSAAANPINLDKSSSTLALARRNHLEGMRNVLKHDQARARSLKARANSQAPPNDDIVYNEAVVYIADIEIGSPPTSYSLIVDTGSSNTWVGANSSNPYRPSSTSKQLLDVVHVKYGSGSFVGTEFEDEVTLAPGLTAKQSIGSAVASRGFDGCGCDGILGLGPTDLTIGTLFPDTTKEIPTVVDNLHSQGKISSPLLSVYFEPFSPTNDKTGLLTYGDIPTGKAKGDILYTPVTTKEPSSHYWGIDQTVRYGSTDILSNAAGIVDTGTTLILIATDAFEQYKKMTGATADSSTGLLSITPSQYGQLQTLRFIIGGRPFNLTPDAQIWPRALNKAIGGDSNGIYLVVADIGDSLDDINFINGMGFLERFLTVYDSDGHRVGFAETEHTTDETNYKTSTPP